MWDSNSQYCAHDIQAYGYKLKSVSSVIQLHTAAICDYVKKKTFLGPMEI